MVLLHLYNGAASIEEHQALDDEGMESVTLGPFEIIQGTHGIELKCYSGVEQLSLPICNEGYVHYKGKVFADYTIRAHADA